MTPATSRTRPPLCAPPSTGAVVGLFDSEDTDKLAKDLFAPPSPSQPLSDDEREHLTAQMPY